MPSVPFLHLLRQKAAYFNYTLLLSVSLIALSSFNYGFDNQAFSTTESMAPFRKRFGYYNAATGQYALRSTWLSMFNSLNYIGFAAGVLLGSAVSSRFGRRWCMFSMSCYALVTATICVTAHSREQIMAGRVLNYIYVGMELSVVPTFQSEIIPAPVRALIVGTYQLGITIGGLVINGTCFGTNKHFSDDRAWRIPLGLFYIIPAIIASGILFVPESPRWLLQHGRPDEARRSLQRLRHGAAAYSDDDIAHEFAVLSAAVAHEQGAAPPRVAELWQGRNCTRTLIVLGVNFFQQATGQAFISQYGATYVAALGTLNSTLFSFINSCVAVAVMVVMLLVADRVGRRTLLLVSAAIMAGALFTMAGLGTPHTVTRPEKTGIMAMMTIFGAGFVAGWAPLAYVVATEVAALRVRDLTLRVGFFLNVLINFAVNFSIPYMVSADYGNLQSRVGFIFGSCVCLAAVFTYFCVPECRGKTLEQIDYLFAAGTRLRDFGSAELPEMPETAETVEVDQKTDKGSAESV